MDEADIATLLPRVVQRSVLPGQPLDALISVMSTLHAETERVLAGLDTLARPWQAPEMFLPYLAQWLDLAQLLNPDAAGHWQLASGPDQLRTLIASATELARWRGTARGLDLFLRRATGVGGFLIEEDVLDDGGAVVPFTIRITVPPAAGSLMPLVHRVIEVAKPAYVRCIVVPAAPTAEPVVEPPAATWTPPPPPPSPPPGPSS